MKALMSEMAKEIKKDSKGQQALKKYLVSGDSSKATTIVLSDGKRFTVSSSSSRSSRATKCLPNKKR